MRAPRLGFVVMACLVSVAILATPATRAAETPAAPDALQQKTEEVERLKRELDLREKELRQLEQENRRLRQDQPRSSGAPVVATPERVLKPVTLIENLAPLTPDAVVDVDELVGHFLAEPANAARRYADKSFRVKGEVDRFDRALVAREFTVLLRSPDRGTTVRFKFNYVGQYHSVFTAKDGRELVARYAAGSEGTLLEVADTVVLGGRCQGLKDGTITFTRSVIVR